MAQAQDAYAHLHDLDWLQECDLRKLPGVQDRVRSTHIMPQAQALRSVLTEAARHVVRDLDSVPGKSRVTAFLEKYLEGRGVAEIAKELGVSREYCSRKYRKEALALASDQFLRLASRARSVGE